MSNREVAAGVSPVLGTSPAHQTGAVSFFSRGSTFWNAGEPTEDVPVKVSTRTLRTAIEEALIRFTRRSLEVILAEELGLVWEHTTYEPGDADTKRALVDGYIDG